jgi:hypothetical protein
MTDAHNSKEPLNLIQSRLELATKLITLAATGCIALSVLFDWGYLAALDLRLSEVPTTLADHTRSAILWLPVLGYVIPLAIAFTLYSMEIDRKGIEEEQRQKKESPNDPVKEAKHQMLGTLIMAVLLVLAWLMLGNRFIGLFYLAIFMLWSLFVVRVTPVANSNQRRSDILRSWLLLPVLIGIAQYSMGYNTGFAAVNTQQSLGTLLVRGESGIEKMKGNIVRPFERFVIVIGDDRKVTLLKPDDIVQVKKAGQILSDEGILCKYWRLLCSTT